MELQTDIVKSLYDRGMKIIDLSADYRLHNPEDYNKVVRLGASTPRLLVKISIWCTRTSQGQN